MKTWLKIFTILWGITYSSAVIPENQRENSKENHFWVTQKITQTCDVHEPSLG